MDRLGPLPPPLIGPERPRTSMSELAPIPLVLLAFGGGVASFLSPCVLPLVPAYLAYVTGAAGAAGKPPPRAAALSGALLFAAGFTTVFVALALAAAGGLALFAAGKFWLEKISGALLILLGLHLAGLLRFALLMREWRPALQSAALAPPALPAGPLRRAGFAYGVGLAFAFGWTPCIGPILGAILTLAASRETAAAALLLAVYGAGLGLPFVIAALAAERALRALAALRHHMRRIEIGAGLLLAATGGLILAGSFEEIGFFLLEYFPVLGRLG